MPKFETLVHPLEDSAHFIAENYALHVRGCDESFPSLDSLETGLGEDTVIRFVFWGHVPQNQQNVIRLLGGCDILALENMQDRVYENVAQKQRGQSVNKATWDILSTLVTGSPLSPKTERRIKRHGLNPDDYVGLDPATREEQIRRFSSKTHAELLIHYSDQVEKVTSLDVSLKEAPRL